MPEALIAAVSALGGALVATLLAHRQRQQHWRGEVRLGAYVDFINLARLFLFRGADVGEHDSDDAMKPREPPLDEQKAAVREVMRLLRDALTRVIMLGPEPLADEAHEIVVYYGRVLYPFFFGLTEPADQQEGVVVRGRQILLDFQTSAASKLDIFRKAR